MSNFIEEITNVNLGVDFIEKTYVLPVLNYLKNKTLGHGYNNKGYTQCYR
jgi:hypothetical protein